MGVLTGWMSIIDLHPRDNARLWRRSKLRDLAILCWWSSTMKKPSRPRIGLSI